MNSICYNGECGAMITATAVGDIAVVECTNGKSMQCDSSRIYAGELCACCSFPRFKNEET